MLTFHDLQVWPNIKLVTVLFILISWNLVLTMPTGCIRLRFNDLVIMNTNHVKNSGVFVLAAGTECMANATLIGDLISCLGLQTSTKYSDRWPLTSKHPKKGRRSGNAMFSVRNMNQVTFCQMEYPSNGNLELVSDAAWLSHRVIQDDPAIAESCVILNHNHT